MPEAHHHRRISARLVVDVIGKAARAFASVLLIGAPVTIFLGSAPARADLVEAAAAAVPEPLLTQQEWHAFKTAYIRSDGRVVDLENGEQSHSEGQGYGMIFAMEAGDEDTFDRIWHFTKRELQIRPSDALLSWRWQPKTRPHVADKNNATDGDILVAYALLQGAARWGRRDYIHEADRLVGDIGESLIQNINGAPVLRPAAFGFDRMDGNRGPVVNLSYYIYPAFDYFELIRPEFPWRQLRDEGLRLTGAARRGSLGLVPDWVSISRSDILLARGFAEKSSYDAVRIPLYMALGGESAQHLAAFDNAWNMQGRGHPVDYDLVREVALMDMKDPGYRMIAALAACASRGEMISPAVSHFRPTTYFASSLHLLGIIAARRHYPQCLSEPMMAMAGTVYIGSGY